MEAGRISTGMTEKKRTLLDIDPADRARLLASATAYAAGRRTYVVGAVSDVVAANAGRLGAAAREALADAIRPAADAGDPIDVPAWTRALAALETAAPDGSDGLDGSPVDLRILLFCAFRHDMGGDGAGLWTRLLDDPPEEILAYVREQRHSRLPVYADSVDNVIGILQIRKYIKACIKAGGKAVDIRPLLDEPVFVHQSTLIAEVLPELSRRKANLAIVTDNYGGTLGIVTVEDIVEELVGEIWDEDDVVEESFVPLGGGRYEVDAEMTVGEVFDRLDYTDPEDDEELRYKLLGEWTYEQFSYIPREREGFRYHRLDVRISDMRQKRIVKLIVRLLPEEPDEAAPAEAAPEKGGEPA